MFGKVLFGLAALSLVSAAPIPFAPKAPPVTELLKDCDQKDGWAEPAPPARIDGQVYYVGTCGITVLLIASPQGHILIDAGPEEAAPLVLANIRRLGLDPRDVKWLLASHTHFDHVGALAALQKATGARIAALPAQARELERGMPFPNDPQFGVIKGFTPVKVDRMLKDGVPLKLGLNQVTAVATPGHTTGSTSWVIRGCGARVCPAIAYTDSTSAISADAYRFSDHPAWVAMFRKGVARIASLPCSIQITPHPAGSQLFERLAGEAPLTDPGQCKRYSQQSLAKLDERLAKERQAK
jgi:metallo-beta-lactamase class B